MKQIPLTQGSFSLVDNEDFDKLNKHKWCLSSSGYANRHPKMINGIRKGKIAIHREVIFAKKGSFVDHINGDKLDNRKKNLRITTHSQNIWNSPIERKTTTKIKNVSISNHGYQVRVQKNGKRYFIGVFKDINKAIKVASEARRKYHGKYVRR